MHFLPKTKTNPKPPPKNPKQMKNPTWKKTYPKKQRKLPTYILHYRGIYQESESNKTRIQQWEIKYNKKNPCNSMQEFSYCILFPFSILIKLNTIRLKEVHNARKIKDSHYNITEIINKKLNQTAENCISDLQRRQSKANACEGQSWFQKKDNLCWGEPTSEIENTLYSW